MKTCELQLEGLIQCNYFSSGIFKKTYRKHKVFKIHAWKTYFSEWPFTVVFKEGSNLINNKKHENSSSTMLYNIFYSDFLPTSVHLKPFSNIIITFKNC